MKQQASSKIWLIIYLLVIALTTKPNKAAVLGRPTGAAEQHQQHQSQQRKLISYELISYVVF